MFFKRKRKRHYALLLKTNSGRLLYQVFDEDGWECDAFPHSQFKHKQNEHNRLTVLFDSAKLITEHEFDYMLAQHGWIQKQFL